MTRSRLAWWATAGATGIVGVLLIEDLASPQLYTLTLYAPGIDKALHFLQSFLIGLVLSAVLKRVGLAPGARLAMAVTGALVAAGLDELRQSWQSNRNVELADFVAGAAGTAAAVSLLIHAMRPRLAATLAVVALGAGGVTAYSTYATTHDFNRGVLAERDGRREDALQHYLRAVETDGNNPEFLNAAAWLMTELGKGQPQEAVALAEKSLSLRPNDPDTLDTFGWALYRAGRAADAVAPLEAALAAKPHIYCVHYHLGMVYLQLGDLDRGIQHLRDQVRLMPATREAGLAGEALAAHVQRVRERS